VGERAGLGADKPGEINAEDDEFEAYRKRMMLAYRFRPNPLVGGLVVNQLTHACASICSVLRQDLAVFLCTVSSGKRQLRGVY
jgi:hypothetical protein